MKKAFYFIASLIMLACSAGCTDYQPQIADLKKQIEELSQACDRSGSNVTAMETAVNAIRSGNPVESVEPVSEGGDVVGYTLSFKEGGKVTVYNQACNVTVGSDNGRYYWKADGEWLKDRKGNRIEVGGEEAPAPQFKIEDSVLKMSLDGGKSWNEAATMAKPLIAKVEDSPECVTITLSDGSSVTIPRAQDYKVTFTVTDVTAYDGETVESEFTVSGAPAGTKIRVIGNNDWAATIISCNENGGTVSITAPADATDSQIILVASDGEGRTFLAGITCTAAGLMPVIPTEALEHTIANIAALQAIAAAVRAGNGAVSSEFITEGGDDVAIIRFKDESSIILYNYSAALTEEMLAGQPQAKIEGFLLMVSADEENWQEAELNDDFVQRIVDSMESVSLTLAGGHVITIPKIADTPDEDAPEEPDRPKFEIFAYNSIPTPYATHETFVKMAEAGFTISESSFTKNQYEGATVLENVIKALDAAEGTGVKLCIPITEWYDPALKAALKPVKTIEEVIGAIKDHPALWGYLIGDEPGANELATYGSYIESYQRLDPNHPWYTCFLPKSDFTDTDTHAQYAEAVANHFLRYPTQFLPFDMYPVKTGNSVANWWYETLENYCEYTQRNNIPLAGMACSVEFEGQAYPSVAALRLQNYTNLAYGCQVLMYFTYMVPYYKTDGWVDGSAPVKLDGTLSEVYDMVKLVNGELNNQAYAFLGSTVKWVRHAKSNPAHTTKLSDSDYMDLGITYFSAQTHTVLSLLENGNSHYLVMVNQSLSKSEEIEIEFSKGMDVQIVGKDGTLVPVGTVITKKHPWYDLAPGDAFILKLD